MPVYEGSRHFPLEREKHGPHSLRHSLASNMLKNNVSMPVIGTVPGHQMGITERRATAEWEADERIWSGEIKMTRRSINMVEFMIYGRSSCMNGVVGKYMSGQYICIPDINVGCPLSRFSDIFWNKERLCAHMREADAVTVAYALKALSEYLGTNWL